MFYQDKPFLFPAEMDQWIRNFFFGHGTTVHITKTHGDNLKKLWKVLAQQRGQQEAHEHYSFHEEMAKTYAMYYLPTNALKVFFLLQELKLLGLNLNFSRKDKWMDFGCGPGTLLWGLYWWCLHEKKEFTYYGVDQSRVFLSLAKKLFMSASSTENCFWIEKPSQVPTRKFIQQTLKEHQPCFVSFLNSFSEVSIDVKERLETLVEMVTQLNFFSTQDQKTRWFFFIEPALKTASRELLELREKLLEKCGESIQVWTPCLNSRPCGAYATTGDWCHETVEVIYPEWIEKVSRAAGMNKESSLFSYLVFSVGPKPQSRKSWPAQHSRVVSQVLKQKGKQECYLCTVSGKQKVRVLDARKTNANESFYRLKRGSLLKSATLNEKNDVIDLQIDFDDQKPG